MNKMQELQLKEQLTILKQMVNDMELPYLRVSLTDTCNARCAFCHNEGQEKTADSSEKIEELGNDEHSFIADFFKANFSRVVFTGGEPLRSTFIYDAVKIYKSFGYNIGLTTNGILLDENTQKKLASAGLDTVNISINSLEKKQYEAFYGVDKLDSVLENMESLPKYISPKNLKLNFVVTKLTDFNSDVERFSLLSKRKGFIVSVLFDIKETDTTCLTKKLKEKLFQLYGHPKEETFNKDKRIKHLFVYKNDALWEFDDYRTYENQFSLKNNSVCRECVLKDDCQEGAYALRLYSDGTFRLCLGRKDNALNIICKKHKGDGKL